VWIGFGVFVFVTWAVVCGPGSGMSACCTACLSVDWLLDAVWSHARVGLDSGNSCSSRPVPNLG